MERKQYLNNTLPLILVPVILFVPVVRFLPVCPPAYGHLAALAFVSACAFCELELWAVHRSAKAFEPKLDWMTAAALLQCGIALIYEGGGGCQGGFVFLFFGQR